MECSVDFYSVKCSVAELSSSLFFHQALKLVPLFDACTSSRVAVYFVLPQCRCLWGVMLKDVF